MYIENYSVYFILKNNKIFSSLIVWIIELLFQNIDAYAFLYYF
jgi:hypothetical protein